MHNTDVLYKTGEVIQHLQHTINEQHSACLQYCIFMNGNTLWKKSTHWNQKFMTAMNRK